MSSGSNEVDWVRSLRKLPATLWHELLHYLHQFSPFCTEFTVVIKHTQMHQNTINAPKHEVTVQWGGSGALIAKNYDVTSWHELLH